jgi:hypothetical protein
MSYSPEDNQPSIFWVEEDHRQGMLTIFNWTDQRHSRSIKFSSLGLPASNRYAISDVFNGEAVVTPKPDFLVVDTASSFGSRTQNRRQRCPRAAAGHQSSTSAEREGRGCRSLSCSAGDFKRRSSPIAGVSETVSLRRARKFLMPIQNREPIRWW